jgi:hypothetical protein
MVSCNAAHHNGRILVARESAAAPGSLNEQQYSGTGELVDMWEPIAGPDAVQTPAEVYAALAAEGLGVRYLRVPVTDGKAPSAGDIDAIMRQVGSAPCVVLARRRLSNSMSMLGECWALQSPWRT